MTHRYDIDPESAGCYMVTYLKRKRRYHASERGCDCEDEDRGMDWEVYMRLKGLKECDDS